MISEQTATDTSSLQNTLKDLEVQRKLVSGAKMNSYFFIGGGILLIVSGLALGNLSVPFIIISAIPLITGFIMLSKAGDKFSLYRHAFKQKVIGASLKSIDQSLEFNYANGLAERDFISSQLFTQRPDRYSSEDQIYGSAGKTKFFFSEVHAEYKTETQTKNGRQVEWHTLLKGIVFCADFNKNFNGLTVVRPKGMGSALGAWIADKIPFLSSSNQQLVKLESSEFNEKFLTYSSDQVEARYILTPALMERLYQLDSKSKYTISISFTGSCVYIAFPLDQNYFEPPVFKSLINSQSIKQDLDIIRFMYNIIAELDLNTRIWSKQ